MSAPIDPKPATEHTRRAQQMVRQTVVIDDPADFDDSRRGFVATLDPMQITDARGTVVWDMERFSFLDGEAPDTVNPSLWRHGQRSRAHGLFTVAPRIHQIRGFDVANMTIIEGDTGYVVIDPLQSPEAASAGMSLVRSHFGDRPIRAVIFSHSHGDHFGGIRGIVTDDEVAAGDVRLFAPAGFFEHAVSENVYAGTPMSRRGTYMYGITLPASPRGAVGFGLGQAMTTGSSLSLLRPTDIVSETGTAATLDGVEFVFQLTPGAEAPAEMNFYLPQFKALCMAETANHIMHNVYTPRGAEIRDALGWSHYLGEALELFGGEAEVLFISHLWPVWGNDGIREFLGQQRDLYRYLHDETLRLAALGHTPAEIAERVELPAELGRYWSNRGYYGSVRHNVKGIYQKYLGWFTGNPAQLDPHEPAEAAKRYVAFMGGAHRVLEQARVSFEQGDYRWVAEVVGHVVFADPGNAEAKQLQADAFEQLGYQAECGPWRNFYLTGAQELRNGTPTFRNRGTAAGDLVRAMTTDMLANFLAIRLNGPRAADLDVSLALTVIDTGDRRTLTARRGVLTCSSIVRDDAQDVTVSTKDDWARLCQGTATIDQLEESGVLNGSGAARAGLRAILDRCDVFDRGFAIVTP